MPELAFPFDAHPRPGEVREVARGVRWLTMPMRGSLNHINVYLLDDHDGWFVVDTGWRSDETCVLWNAILDRELRGSPVKGVICTHMHPDHTGMAFMITERFRCPLYMTRTEYYQARAFSASGSSSQSNWQHEEFYRRAGVPGAYLEQMRRIWEDRVDDGGMMPPMPHGYRRLQDGEVLRIGPNDWQVVIGSGHSSEHACLHCQGLGVMISGDQILPVITSNVSVFPVEPEANPLKVWMESHDKFLGTPAGTLVLPAHNLPFYGIRDRLRQLIDHHEDRMLAIEEHCGAPTVTTELLPVLFRRALDPRQMILALGEAIAHLHLLVYRNRVERMLDADGIYRYRSIDPDLARRAHPGLHAAPEDGPVMV